MEGSHNQKKLKFCTPCLDDRKTLKAYGYCKNCGEFLCEECFQYHKVPSLTKKHLLLELTEALNLTLEPKDQDRSTLPCPNHSYKNIQYHCLTHSILGCSICAINEHRKCDDLLFIPTVSKALVECDDYQTFHSYLKYLKSKGEDIKVEMTSLKDGVLNSYNKAVLDIQALATEIINKIRKTEQELLTQAICMKDEEERTIEALIAKQADVEQQVNIMSERANCLENADKLCNLYIEIFNADDKFNSLDQQLDKILEESVDINTILFEANIDCSEMECMGDLYSSDVATVEAHFVKNIAVGCISEKKDCRISSMAFIPDRHVALTDYTNKSLKLIDTNSNEFCSVLDFSYQPRSVALVNTSQVAVTFPTEQTIAIVSIEPSLNVTREVKVTGRCYGIASVEKNLIVSFINPHKIEIQDLYGTVICKFENTPPTEGNECFVYPYQVSVNPCNNLIYVSNFTSHTVVCMASTGRVIATYKDSELQNPLQTVFDTNGFGYICGQISHNIHQVTEKGKKIKEILSKEDGLRYPESLCRDTKTGKLFVGMQNKNFVKMFILK